MNPLFDRIANIVQIIKSNNLLTLPTEIHLELEEVEPDKEGNYNLASACVIDHVIHLHPILELMPDEVLLDTTCHELVHLEQAELGWITLSRDNRFVWFGKKFAMAKNYEEYMNLPWERDAYRRSPEIMREVKKIMKGQQSVSGTC